ncbi:ergosterol biosynthesis ERG4/ERG24 family protein [Colletotrichum graminicola M1.001]|uniref:Delta(24(24(1)))-sterol reductase n=1 Tax=Colletotrichum graminicola (strain M1.001 / M2 / FGSC 10212) TaxID=645133 RepID=E3QND0_COLGM|nr:ergosterol biosynthesis ERG4/ERG24 family protein [Colletotrichum graminicola M1.001]EFQ32368.1 ergosterol biosynthesis ERG4/ERG24 family protein [Colletotrichum graminicola M1.001]
MSSNRYSLRQTPRKKELFDGMVETPRRVSSRRKSPETATGAEVTESKPESRAAPRRRTTGKFREEILHDEAEEPLTNGHTNGYANGHANGHVKEEKEHAVNSDGHAINGHLETKTEKTAEANGHVHSETKEVLPAYKKGEIIDGWEVGTDPKIDASGEFEFGGSLGALSLMIGFPLLMWYMWIGATYYDGKLPMREDGQTWGEFGRHLVDLVYTGAFPTLRAWRIYWTFFIFEGICYCVLPGVWAWGKPLPHENGKQLKYFCNAYISFYFTISVMAVLHFSGLFPVYTFIDEFGPLMSVAILSGFIVSFIAYFSALWRGAQHRMTGYPIYDFFLGAELNPRMFGILDFKMFFEVRIPWFILFGLSCGAAARQYEQYGYVSGEVLFLVMAHYLYANACAKGEQLIVPTWDMYYEKWGFMLIFWNLAGVPLSYCHCTIYLANRHPSEYKWNPYALTLLFVSYLFAYWVWDTTNSQKNSFRAQERGQLTPRRTFPQLPWQTVKNPKTITSAKGDVILADGWYGYARKIHYTCDAFFAICWGLITGFNSPFPWFYPVFFCGMIAHRAARDIHRCRQKYGDAWAQYEREVPYLFIPYVI